MTEGRRRIGRFRDWFTRSTETPPADLLVAAGVVDQEYYEAQTGRTFETPRDAAAHCLSPGTLVSPHPLLDFASLADWHRDALRESGDAELLLRYLTNRGSELPTGPLFDPRELRLAPEIIAAHPGGALGAFLAASDDATELPGRPGLTLGRARREMIAAARRFAVDPTADQPDRPRWDRALATRVPGRASVVIAATDAAASTRQAVAAALRHRDDLDVEVVLVDGGSRHDVLLSLHAAFFDQPRVHVLRLRTAVDAREIGVAESTGEYVVLVDHSARPRPGWLPPLLATLADDSALAAQPLLLNSDDSVRDAGDGALVGHPPEDALRRRRGARLRSVDAEAVAMRATDMVRLRGIPARAPREGLRLAVESWVNVTAAEPEHRGQAQAASAQAAPDTDRPLRWGIRISSLGGEEGDSWGDTHFARSLSTSLSRLGHEVVVHRREAGERAPAMVDDVVLGLRGLRRVPPVPGRVNILWIISHPERVTDEELEGFDLVYAASEPWAAELAARSGREVGVLLQATDPALRADMTEPVGDGSRPVFVGGAPIFRIDGVPTRRPRPVVEAAVAARVPAVIHGPWWDRLLPSEYVGEPYIPNNRLMSVYREAGLVLADHWGDMAGAGFIANRIFDAVASGARVISDPVPGLEMFSGAVQTFTTAEELAFLCSPAGRSRFPDDAEMARIADRVTAEHSFDRRAETLTVAVRSALDAR